MKNLKKLLFAPVAALALAGALSAINGAAWINPSGSITIVGEGASPCPMVLATVPASRNSSSGERF